MNPALVQENIEVKKLRVALSEAQNKMSYLVELANLMTTLADEQSQEKQSSLQVDINKILTKHPDTKDKSLDEINALIEDQKRILQQKQQVFNEKTKDFQHVKTDSDKITSKMIELYNKEYKEKEGFVPAQRGKDGTSAVFFLNSEDFQSLLLQFAEKGWPFTATDYTVDPPAEYHSAEKDGKLSVEKKVGENWAPFNKTPTEPNEEETPSPSL